MSGVALSVTPTDESPSTSTSVSSATFGPTSTAPPCASYRIAALVNVQTGDITVVDARNVLRNADIDVLNNALNNLNVEILNNSEILSDIEISNILNDLNVNVEDVVVAVNVLGGTVIFLQ